MATTAICTPTTRTRRTQADRRSSDRKYGTARRRRTESDSTKPAKTASEYDVRRFNRHHNDMRLLRATHMIEIPTVRSADGAAKINSHKPGRTRALHICSP